MNVRVLMCIGGDPNTCECFDILPVNKIRLDGLDCLFMSEEHESSRNSRNFMEGKEILSHIFSLSSLALSHKTSRQAHLFALLSFSHFKILFFFPSSRHDEGRAPSPCECSPRPVIMAGMLRVPVKVQRKHPTSLCLSNKSLSLGADLPLMFSQNSGE